MKILDLAPFLTSPTSPPAVISKFTASRRQPIGHIAFASDGNSLIIWPEDRRVIRLFHVIHLRLKGSSRGIKYISLPNQNNNSHRASETQTEYVISEPVRKCRAERIYILLNHYLCYFHCASNPVYLPLPARARDHVFHLSGSRALINQLRSH
jgi:hypothetical protein